MVSSIATLALLGAAALVQAVLPNGRPNGNVAPRPSVPKILAKDTPITDVKGAALPPLTTVYNFQQLVRQSHLLRRRSPYVVHGPVRWTITMCVCDSSEDRSFTQCTSASRRLGPSISVIGPLGNSGRPEVCFDPRATYPILMTLRLYRTLHARRIGCGWSVKGVAVCYARC
jgi:hypothetical protein